MRQMWDFVVDEDSSDEERGAAEAYGAPGPGVSAAVKTHRSHRSVPNLAAYGSGGPPDGGGFPPWGARPSAGSGGGDGVRQRTGGGSAGNIFGGGAAARPIPFGSSTSPSAQGGFLSSSLPTGWDNHPVGATPAKSSFLAARASGPGGGSAPMHASQSDPALSATSAAASAQRRSVHFGAQPASGGARSGPGANSWIAHAEHAAQSTNTGSGMRRSRSEGDFVRIQSERSVAGSSSFGGAAGAEPAARSFGRSDNRFGGRASAPAGFMMSAASAARSERAPSPPQEAEDMQECLDILLGEGMEMDGDDDGGVFSFGFGDGDEEGRPRIPSAAGGLSFG